MGPGWCKYRTFATQQNRELVQIRLVIACLCPPKKVFFSSNVILFAQGPSEECKEKTIARGMSEAVKAAMVAKHNELRRK